MKNTFRDIFNRTADKFDPIKQGLHRVFNRVAEKCDRAKQVAHRFCVENPMKVYTAIYLIADGCGLWYGWAGDHPWWLASAVVGGASNINKLIYGAGGQWIPGTQPPSAKEILLYPAEVTKFALGVVTPSYLGDLTHAFRKVNKQDLCDIVEAFDVRNYKEKPLDVGMAGYLVTGGLIVADGISRGCIPSLISGAACIAGAAISLATKRMDLAGRAFSPSSLTVGYMAFTTPDEFLPLLGQFIGYMTGNKVLSYVDPDHQSAHHAPKNAEITPPQG